MNLLIEDTLLDDYRGGESTDAAYPTTYTERDSCVFLLLHAC